MKNSKKKRRKRITKLQQMTFSKRWMSIILAFSLLWITLSYVLAFLDKADIAQELSKQIVIVVISTLLAYFAKSFFETKEEEHIKLMRDEIERSEVFNNYADESINEEGIYNSDEELK